MSTHNIRLGSMLSFDEEKEKDIVNMIDKLNSSHKTGQFISNLIRIAFDTPELLYKSNGIYEKGEVLKQLDTDGISKERQKFFNQTTKDIKEMQAKVDKIYNMTFKVYMLSLMGKHLDIEEKADNLLLGNFVLEKQIKDIEETLGIDLPNQIYASNRKDNTHELADEVLEYIITAYDGILGQLKTNIVMQPQMQVQQIQPQMQPVQQVQIQPQVQMQQTVTQAQQQPVKVDNTGVDENAIIDFGDADMGALMDFFDM